MLLIQILFVMLSAKLLGAVFNRLGQPQVVGEMIAGFVLGPVVLGQLFPTFHQQLFDSTAVTQLKVLSELGILLFMFVIGAEFRFPLKQSKTGFKAMVIGAFSIVIPFLSAPRWPLGCSSTSPCPGPLGWVSSCSSARCSP
jgi:Kef-type K+ transport system membrane component KefB